MQNSKEIKALLELVKGSTSQFHTIETMKKQLLEQEYEELAFGTIWNLKPGGKYVAVQHGSCGFAFSVGSEFTLKDDIRIAAAHGDFPGFRIKPNPEIITDGFLQLNVESYGGVTLASWLDRPLSIAGRVVLKSKDIFHPEVRLIDVKRPILTIPNIAIHLEKNLNKGVELNKQTHMLPVMMMTDESEEKGAFNKFLANELEVNADDILDYELQIYNTDRGALIGIKEELLSAPRLDNLTSVQALISGLLEGEREKGINIIGVFDHEEIGSKTKQGAGSTLLATLLEKIYVSLGYHERDCKEALSRSLFMSVDVSHGIHPSYVKKNDPTNKNILNKGICIKEACSQAYATDSEAIGIVQQICEAKGIPYQKSVNRSDGTGGGTLGSIASAMLPVRTVDLGVPLLAMHSSRELMGVKDQEYLVAFMSTYFCIQ